MEAFSVSQFVELTNNSLEYAFSGVKIVGEVASFKVNQGKWVFFDLKDEESSVSCFMPLWELRMPIEDGMKIVINGLPKLTKWGKFSVTVRQIAPVGEGNIKKSFELLKKKLFDEGLFDPARKRPIPEKLTKIGVISSTQAAGYADFCKILNARWGGLSVLTAHTQVQGMDAADQIIRALEYFNEHGDVQIIAVIRGGGSADDLAVFNDEKLVRAIAASKIPVITGIGHEVDESLSDLAADVRASTPSNVAEMLTPDKNAEISRIKMLVSGASQKILQESSNLKEKNTSKLEEVTRFIEQKIDTFLRDVKIKEKMLASLNPESVLAKGYAIVRGELKEGNEVAITLHNKLLKAQILSVKERNNNG